MPMIAAIRRLLMMIQGDTLSAAQIAQFGATHDFRIALAGLLVHAGNVDGEFADTEKHHVRRLLVEQLGISSTEAAELMILVNHKHLQKQDVDELVEELVGKLGPSGRENLIDWLWQVIAADHIVTQEESGLVRALADKIGIEAKVQAAIAARYKVLNTTPKP